MSDVESSSSDLRRLQFERLDQVAEESQRLLQSGYTRCGNWTLGQICRHLRLVQDSSIDGYPKWISMFAPLRPVIRAIFLDRILKGNSPKGVRTMPMFVPPEDSDDQTEVDALLKSIDRFKSHEGEFYPHPGFGRRDRESLEQIHAAHAAHHLRFLSPAD